MSNSIASRENVRPVVVRILALSGIAFFFLLWLLYFKTAPEPHSKSLSFLPALNALLNGLAATSICAGVVAIKLRKPRVHMSFMITAVVLSGIFLVSYITYHSIHGDTKFVTEGTIRYVYFFVLISHIACTVFALPLIMSAIYFAITKRFAIHKRVVKYTVPLWLYVSITGVAIYFLLRGNS